MDETKEASNCFSIGKYAAIASIPILRSFPISVTAPVEAWSEATPYFQEPVMFGPNITGSFGRLTGTRGVDAGNFSGAFALNGASNLSHGGQDTATNARNSDFDASRCSVIYGETETVQPPALRALACIKV